jgi:hypothetical protein
MSENFKNYYQNTYFCTFIICVAILPMSETIALRNILLAFMIVLFSLGNLFSDEIRRDSIQAAKWVPLPLILWIFYLCIFPMWAPMADSALANLRGQWGESIVAWVAGFGAVVILGRRGPSLLQLAYASAFPLFVHLVLAALAFIGVFSPDFYQPYTNWSMARLMIEINLWFSGGFDGLQPYHPITDGFHGIEVMSGNLGYPSSVAIALFVSQLFKSKIVNKESMFGVISCLAAIGFMFLSLLIVRSRGGMVFGLFVLFSGILWSIFLQVLKRGKPNNQSVNDVYVARLFGIPFIAAVLLAGVGYQALKVDPRWLQMTDKIQAGFIVADPVATLCQGLSPEDESLIRASFTASDSTYVDGIIQSIENGDGGRVILMRAGWKLALDNPLGLDGSRQSYERLMEARCQYPPKLNYGHSHNSWLDMSMAIGWIGVMLFAAMLVTFFWTAVKMFSVTEGADVYMALGLLAGFWFVRGFFDSLYREHYLEMQALVMIYLYFMALRSRSKIE